LSLESAKHAAISSSTGPLAGPGISAIRSAGNPTFVDPATLHPKSTKVPKKGK
jgi:hypothetical protein